MDLVFEKLNKAKQVLNLSDDEFKGVCLAIDEMKNKQKVNQGQKE
ncbi:hypothetical protein [Maribacter sp. 4G9]|nr:hypothetical protein [Maribacter sp. 4G9]|tara:strand:- start:711 stop:845 length:135 start_codon:yes stop_codon:yes gene_type:complete